MRKKVLLDTGVLVAFINRREKLHSWAVEQWKMIEPPLLTCEAVITDACLVRMSELIAGSCVLTLDSDFLVYRKNKNQIIDLIIPN
jgi:hypothetical protein